MNQLFKNKLIVFLLLIPYFKPGYVANNIPTLSKLYSIMLVFSGVIILMLYIYRRKISKMMIAMIIYKTILLLVTIFQKGDIYRVLLNSFTTITLMMYVEYYIQLDAQGFFSVLSRSIRNIDLYQFSYHYFIS